MIQIGNDRQDRRYLQFLLAAGAVLMILLTLNLWAELTSMRSFLFRRECAAAASLLEAGVPASTIAGALSKEEVNAEAETLLARMGHDMDTPFWMLPGALEALPGAVCRNLLPGIFFLAVLFSGTVFWMRKREERCHQARSIVRGFLEGKFDRRLPRTEEGELARLLGEVDELAAVLQARNESERRTKEFLRDTISDISHQLKTPLAALLMYLEIIESEPEHIGTVQEFTAKSLRSLRRMEYLIQMLLKIARLDAGSIRFEEEDCPLDVLLARASSELLSRAVRERKSLVLETPDRDAVLRCDPQWTAEALENLIKNALDHTREGGVIRVRAECTPALVRIVVEDDGEGISPKDIHHIFKRFYRSADGTRHPGAGLGLSLAKTIVEGQGGFLTAASEPGGGAAFTVSFLI